MIFRRLARFVKSIGRVETMDTEAPAEGWELMRVLGEEFLKIHPRDRHRTQFRMSQATWDRLCELNNLHGRHCIAGDTAFGVPVRIWPHVPNGEIWSVSEDLLKDLGEMS